MTAEYRLENLELLTRRDPDLARGLNLFGSNFNELMATRDDKDPAYEQTLERARHSILRLVDSVFGLQLEESKISLAELIARAKKLAEADKNGGVTLEAAFLKTVGFMDKAIDEAGKFPNSAEPGSGALGKIRVKRVSERVSEGLRDVVERVSGT